MGVASPKTPKSNYQIKEFFIVIVVVLHSSIRLKIKRGDVHFGYNTVRGSARVYKAELNGEVCAAKVRGLELHSST